MENYHSISSQTYMTTGLLVVQKAGCIFVKDHSKIELNIHCRFPGSVDVVQQADVLLASSR